MLSILKTALKSCKDIKKPHKKFILYLINAIIVCQGKATFRNMSRYCEISEKCFSRWYRRSFNFFKLNCLMLFTILKNHEEFIVALDASFIPKSGKKTEGLGMFYNGSLGDAEKGLKISLLSLIDVNSKIAYALDAKQTIDEEGKSRVISYVNQVINCSKRLIEKRVNYLVADAYYFKKTL